jgi:hypothetical protein
MTISAPFMKFFSDSYLRLSLALFGSIFLRVVPASAQWGDEAYAVDNIGGPTLFQRLMTHPAASLIMVLAGSAGLFMLFFATGKGEKSDKQQFVGGILVLLVLLMCWYRFSLWNDPSFNQKPSY